MNNIGCNYNVNTYYFWHKVNKKYLFQPQRWNELILTIKIIFLEKKKY